MQNYRPVNFLSKAESTTEKVIKSLVNWHCQNQQVKMTVIIFKEVGESQFLITGSLIFSYMLMNLTARRQSYLCR
jgi:hypothetical protein